MNKTPERQHFEEMCRQLGKDKAFAFFKFALPHLEQRYEDLLHFVKEGESEKAVKQAHLIKGTVNVFGSGELITILENIITSSGSIDEDRFLLLQKTIQNNLQQIKLLIESPSVISSSN
jgi:translation initiation factor 2 beta subunit (eIF-2beta)/eIF-5